MRSFSKSRSLNRTTLTVFDHDPEQERLVQVEDQQQPDETDAVLLDKRLNFPVKITEWVLEETRNVLECSPFLSHIARLSGSSNEFGKITISLLCKGSIILWNLIIKVCTYLPIISALSLMLGTPNMRPWIPEILCLK